VYNKAMPGGEEDVSLPKGRLKLIGSLEDSRRWYTVAASRRKDVLCQSIVVEEHQKMEEIFVVIIVGVARLVT
jgi:hypothetical protein